MTLISTVGAVRTMQQWLLRSRPGDTSTDRDLPSWWCHRRNLAFGTTRTAANEMLRAVCGAAGRREPHGSGHAIVIGSEEGHEPKANHNKDGFMAPESNAFGDSFRNYEQKSERNAIVENFYRKNHIYQTYEFAKKKKEEFSKLDKVVMGIWDCCELLHDYVDESDPDLDDPQIEHLLQSAEAIRRDYPNEDWLHLTALIHDLGKVMLHPSFGEQPQWSVVGDTFPLGCAFDEGIVHSKYFKENPDFGHPVYSTKLGVYEENCGLDNVTMTWGHDEYMYLVVKGNNTKLPPAALFIIRFHSFYALHRNGAYRYLMNEEDEETLKWVLVFNKYDLYSKSKVRIDLEEVKPYYQSLIEKYFPEKLRW